MEEQVSREEAKRSGEEKGGQEGVEHNSRYSCCTTILFTFSVCYLFRLGSSGRAALDASTTCT